MAWPDQSIKEILSAYAEPRVRAHAWGRALSAPLRAVEELIPRSGTVLDFGCGHGLFSFILAATSPDRHVVGVDIDAAKIQSARAAAHELGVADRVELSVIEPGWLPSGPIDGTRTP